MRLPRLLEPLRHRDFRLLWFGQTVSLFGNFMYTVALPFQMLALGASPLQLGLALSFSTGAMLLCTLVGGVVVDRVPRRRVILANDLIAGGVTAVVTVLSATGQLRLEHLYAASAIFGAAFAFMAPAMTAILPELVPAEVLQSGNAMRGLSRQLSRVTGPVAGGIAVGVGGPALAFGIDAATFFVSFFTFLLARPPRHEPPPPAPLLRQMREGLAFTFSLPWLWITIFGFSLVVLAFAGSSAVALPLFVRDVLHGDASMFGAIETAIGAGEIAGSVVMARVLIRRIGVAMYASAILCGIALGAMGLVASLPPVLAFGALQGATLVGFGILWETALQKHVPRALLGRVVSVDYFGALLLGPIGPFLTAALVETVGPARTIVIGGWSAAALCMLALLVPSIRRLE